MNPPNFVVMKIYIKNMVCPRCIASVKQILNETGIPFHSVELGEVETVNEVDDEKKNILRQKLEATGFELLDNPSKKIIEQVKILLIQKIREGIEDHFSIQKYISGHVFKDYSSVSKLFSEVEGITIEQFFILQKIEKVKELLVYNEQPLSEIALQLGYSSTQHLSSQFKRLIGMTPSEFKKIGNKIRKPIDRIWK